MRLLDFPCTLRYTYIARKLKTKGEYTKMDYSTMTMEDIIKWCQENKQVKWLKEEAKKQVPYKVYPRIKVTDASGKTVSKADKSKPYTVEMRPITYIQIKQDFVRKFMPELIPHKDKKPSFYEIIENL